MTRTPIEEMPYKANLPQYGITFEISRHLDSNGRINELGVSITDRDGSVTTVMKRRDGSVHATTKTMLTKFNSPNTANIGDVIDQVATEHVERARRAECEWAGNAWRECVNAVDKFVKSY